MAQLAQSKLAIFVISIISLSLGQHASGRNFNDHIHLDSLDEYHRPLWTITIETNSVDDENMHSLTATLDQVAQRFHPLVRNVKRVSSRDCPALDVVVGGLARVRTPALDIPRSYETPSPRVLPIEPTIKDGGFFRLRATGTDRRRSNIAVVIEEADQSELSDWARLLYRTVAGCGDPPPPIAWEAGPSR